MGGQKELWVINMTSEKNVIYLKKSVGATRPILRLVQKKKKESEMI